MGYECKILADSLGPNGARITTFQRTYPRYILAEQNTHKIGETLDTRELRHAVAFLARYPQALVTA